MTHTDFSTSRPYLTTPTSSPLETKFTDPAELTYLKNLNQRLMSEEQIRLDAMRAGSKERHQCFLLRVVKLSKDSAKYTKAATNAAAILIKTGFSFSGEDLRGICIPSADLSNGVFEKTQFQGADLREVNLKNCCLNHANFTGPTRVDNIQLGLNNLKKLSHSGIDSIIEINISPDNRYLLSRGFFKTNVWDIATGERLAIKNADNVVKTFFLAEGKFLISCFQNGMVQLSSFPTLQHAQNLVSLSEESHEVIDAQHTYDNSFLILRKELKGRSDNAGKIEIYKIKIQAEKFSQINSLEEITLQQEKQKEFSFSIQKIRVSPQSNFLAIAALEQSSIFVRILCLPSLKEAAICEIESEILDLQFSLDGKALIIAKKRGLFVWYWEKEKEPIRCFPEDLSQSSHLRIIPFDHDFMFGYVMNGEWHTQRKDCNPTLYFRDSSGKCICQLPFDNTGNPFFGRALYEISRDGSCTIIVRSTDITILPTKSLLNSISHFKKNIVEGEFSSDKRLSLSDGNNYYHFEAKTGRFIREEKVHSQAKTAQNDLFSVCIQSTDEQVDGIEVRNNLTNQKILHIPISKSNKHDQIQIILDKYIVYANRLHLILWQFYIEQDKVHYEKLKVWQHEGSLGQKKFLYKQNTPFLLLVGSESCLLVDLESYASRQLQWGKDNDQYDDWFEILDFKNLSFDIASNVCALCCKMQLFEKTGIVLLWDVKTGTLIEETKAPFGCFSVKFSLDGSLLACIGLNGVRMWQVDQKYFKLLWRVPSYLEAEGIQLNLPDWSPKLHQLLVQLKGEEQIEVPDEKKLEQIEANLDELNENNPETTIRILTKLYTFLFKKREFARALKQLLKLLNTLNSLENKIVEIANTQINIGAVYAALKQYKKAIRWTKKAKEILKDKDTSIIDMNLSFYLLKEGEAFFHNGQLDKAIQKLEKADAIVSSIELKLKADIQAHLGHLYHLNNNFDQAFTHFNTAVLLDPSSKTFYAMGNYLYRQKKYDVAVAYLQKAIRYKEDGCLLIYNKYSESVIDKDLHALIGQETLKLNAGVLAYHLLIRCHLALAQKSEGKKALEQFQEVSNTRTDQLTQHLVSCAETCYQAFISSNDNFEQT